MPKHPLDSNVDRKLFEAFMNRRGCRLEAHEVDQLILSDDAIGCRICNMAGYEAGVGEVGNIISRRNLPKTWKAFVNHVKNLFE